MNTLCTKLAIAVAAVTTAAASAFAQTPNASTETFKNWQVVCRGASANAQCAIIQQQAMKSGNTAQQRLLAVELVPTDVGARGTMILPFGLDFEKGVKLKVKNTPGTALRFKTCLPAGCLIDLNFGQDSLKALAATSEIIVEVTAVENQAVSNLTIPLEGFPDALDRARSQMKQRKAP